MQPFAQRVAKQLPAIDKPLFGSAEDIPQVLIAQGTFLRIPPVTAPTFIHELLKHCLDRAVSAILPLGRDELYPLAQARPLFSEYGVAVWLPEISVLAGVAVLENPPKGVALHISPEGVFAYADSGEEKALCCIAD